MIPRILSDTVLSRSREYPVVTVTGPRQSGKTTLARAVFPDKPYANLEASDTRAFAVNDPRGFLSRYPEGAVLDEIQRAPELTSYIQEQVDAKPGNGRFVLTGSQQFEIMHGVSQSLAGRTALLRLLPFSYEELEREKLAFSTDEWLTTGFLPRIHDQHQNPVFAWRDYISTYVERDLRQLVQIRDLALFDRFIRLCAGRVGQLLNLQSLANDTGVSQSTARGWLSLLEASCVVIVLQPWYANIGKRLVKSPKLYFMDAAMAVNLCGVDNPEHLSSHPLRGAFFENLLVAEAIKFHTHRGLNSRLFFYRDSNGVEIDLLVPSGNKVLPIEFKSSQTACPEYLKGVRLFGKAARGFSRDTALVCYDGDEEWPSRDGVIIPWRRLSEALIENIGRS